MPRHRSTGTRTENPQPEMTDLTSTLEKQQDWAKSRRPRPLIARSCRFSTLLFGLSYPLLHFPLLQVETRIHKPAMECQQCDDSVLYPTAAQQHNHSAVISSAYDRSTVSMTLSEVMGKRLNTNEFTFSATGAT